MPPLEDCSVPLHIQVAATHKGEQQHASLTQHLTSTCHTSSTTMMIMMMMKMMDLFTTLAFIHANPCVVHKRICVTIAAAAS